MGDLYRRSFMIMSAILSLITPEQARFLAKVSNFVCFCFSTDLTMFSHGYFFFKCCNIRYSPTTTSHTRYTSCVVHACFSVDREIITRVPTNSHACKLNTRDSYTSCSHACAINFLVLSACESRLVTQFYKSNATSALVPVSKIYVLYLRRICQCCGLLA